MSLTDPVADFLARIRNAINARHQKIDVPASKLKLEIARILKEEGFVANYKSTEEDGKKVIRVYLKYSAKFTKLINSIESCRSFDAADASRRDRSAKRTVRKPTRQRPGGVGEESNVSNW